MKVSFYTLGCKVNQHETGSMQQLFINEGYTLAADGEQADVYVVNSCTVTAGGDKKSRQWLRRCKRENPFAITVLTGCLPQAFPQLADEIAEADVVTGSSARHDILRAIQQFREQGRRVVTIAEYTNEDLFEELPAAHFEGHTRAFVKVEDGCNRFCAYCIIPYARGRVRSRNEKSILREIEALAAEGYREVVITGINLCCYGQDTGTNLAELVEKAAAIQGIQRIRLGSLEPDLLPEETLLRLAAVKSLCPQFHLSLQSGCDKTLARMGRTYTSANYAALLAHLRELFFEPEFTTDIIVGFPGESEADFCESMAFVKSCGFLKVHVFSYSPRPGTAAAEFNEQIPEQVKQRRHAALTDAAEIMRISTINTRQGLPQEILLEKPLSQNLFTGYTRGYIPVAVKAHDAKQGDIVNALLGAYNGARCRCETTRNGEENAK